MLLPLLGPLLPGVLIAVAQPALDVRLGAEAGTVEVARQQDYRIRIRLSLTLTNRESRPVLLLVAEEPRIVAAALGESRDQLEVKSAIMMEYWQPSFDSRPQWADMARRLMDPALDAQSAGLAVIAAGGAYRLEQTIDFFTNEGGASSVFPRRPTMQQLKEKRTLWVRVWLQTWPANLERASPTEGFGKGVAAARRGAGYLLLEPLVSDPVPIVLPGFTDLPNLKKDPGRTAPLTKETPASPLRASAGAHGGRVVVRCER